MHKKLKSIIALAIAAMLVSQFNTIKNSNVKAASSTSITSNCNQSEVGGFKLESKKWIKDLNCNAYIYIHAKSGAHLIYLETDSTDKMICVNFKTPTKDNTGVNHVIEHSVLCGSKNYPIKDLLNQVGKQSMSTFLNAMTSNDSTMYPVSSKNDKDFQNLMNIYLDAVFYPNVLKDKRIFNQEGIRYELNSPEDQLKLNGVVYNEMKGNYSNPDRILHKAIETSLFPDTSYKYESGGLPEAMPSLTYDELVKTYSENYNPANSYFYLCGKMNINEKLKLIGEKYLNNFDKKEVKTDLKLQKPFTKRVEKSLEYSVSKETPIENKTYLALNYVIDNSKNVEVVEAFNFLQTLLGGIPSSPITKALKDNGFGENVSVNFDFSNFQPILTIEADNVNEKDKYKFEKVINDTFKNICEKGIDSETLDSIFKTYELSNRMVQGDFALAYNNLIMRSWLYGGDPTAYLNINSDMGDVKNKFKLDYIKNLIQKYLLNNSHSSLVVLKPVQGLEEKKEAELKTNLAKYKDSLSKDEINTIVKNTEELKKWQNQPNTEEELNTLPTLTREDINKDVKNYKTVEITENGLKTLKHPIFTNGIDYIFLYFDTSTVPQDKLGYISLLSEILTNIDTKNYSKEKLTEKIMINSGGISFSPTCLTQHGNNDLYSPKMQVSLISLSENVSNSFELLKEIIFNSKLDDTKRLKEVIHTLRLQSESNLTFNGSMTALNKVSEYLSESGKYNGYFNEGFYKFLCDLDENFDNKSNEIIKNLKEVKNLIFNREDMIVSFTGSDENYKDFKDKFNKFYEILSHEHLKKYNYKFDESNINEGLIIPSKVQYVVKGGDLKEAGYSPNGKLPVLQNIIESDYLWNNVRVKGGAYGANMTVDNENILFSSYRDPNLKETIDSFNNIPEYLNNFKANDKQMDNYIISAAAKEDNSTSMLNALLGPAADGIIADSLYLTGTKHSDLQKERDALISTNAEDIRNFAPIIDALLKQNYLCVVGGESQIENNKENFITIKNILDDKNKISNTISMDKKENLPVNKSITVKFSDTLDPVTVNTSNICVLDNENHKIKIKVSYDKYNKSISIEPEKSYEKGESYTLFIKGIQPSSNGKKTSKLIAPMKMEFSTEK